MISLFFKKLLLFNKANVLYKVGKIDKAMQIYQEIAELPAPSSLKDSRKLYQCIINCCLGIFSCPLYNYETVKNEYNVTEIQFYQLLYYELLTNYLIVKTENYSKALYFANKACEINYRWGCIGLFNCYLKLNEKEKTLNVLNYIKENFTDDVYASYLSKYELAFQV